MSFSEKVKDELSRKNLQNKCCSLSEISAFAHVSGKIELKGSGNVTFHMHTEHSPTARHIFSLMSKKFDIHADLITKENILKKKHIYSISINDYDIAKSFLYKIRLLDQNGSLKFNIDDSLLQHPCCDIAFLRGCFLGSGSVLNPEKGYHLEIVSNSKEFCDDLLNILYRNDVKANSIIRKEKHVTYIKESDSIIRFLTLIGAFSSILSLENIRISKEMNNNINRAANCDAANFSKTVDASVKQVQAIMHLEEMRKLEKLSLPLQAVAEARINNKYATLNELVDILDNKVGKSGVNYRLKKICEISENLK